MFCYFVNVAETKTIFFEEITLSKDPHISLEMTTRSQKRKTTAEPNPTSLKTLLAENNHAEELIPGPSKNPRTYSKNLDDIKSSLSKEIMSDLTK